MSRLKKRNDDLNIEAHKMRMDRDLALEENINLKEQMARLNETLNRHKIKIEELKANLKDKDVMIQKLGNQNEYLKNNKEIIRQTKHLFP